MAAASSSTATTSAAPANRHVASAVDKQRAQLEKLLKDPVKPAFIPAAPKEKIIRPAREMMKNVQGSSAGAGSGEFHVYKASRRREYERLKLLDEISAKEIEDAEFERKRKEAEAITDAKTAKNRSKRQKKKERAKSGKGAKDDDDDVDSRADSRGRGDAPIKKRRLVNGKELVFKKPGEEDSDEDGEDAQAATVPEPEGVIPAVVEVEVPRAVEEAKIIIHEDF